MSLLGWNEAQVQQFFISLGITRYERAIQEHALTGDVLIHLTHELLKDIGIKSVGKRLTILKAIYKLKLKEDIPIEDGHWTPPLGDFDQDGSEADTHSDLSPLLATPTTPQKHPQADLFSLSEQRIKNLESDVRTIKQELKALSARFLSLSSSTPNSPSILVEAVPRTSSTRAQDRHMREESICQLDIHEPSPASPARSQTNPIIPPQEDPKPSQPPSPDASSIASPTQEARTQPSPTDRSPATETLCISATPKATDRPSRTEKQTTKEHEAKERDALNPYKSFRVTLEDPCYKVLPAALKKYKINEHYKNYVLFICYGKQERCLSYEEKPLLLFQKLKEANQNPVFTLRHIKDIESPVSLALAKQAQRRDKKLASSALKVPSSGKAADQANTAAVSQARKTPPNSGRVEKASGFCIAIYPYMSEGEDDLDVGVGDTFIIVGKSKGWWVVNRDKGPETLISEDHQGWIPSGCLLETKKSFSIGVTGKVNYETTILPDEILSVSSACYGLMDYKAKGTDELGFDIKDRLKVYKKYNNWSYAINESQPDKPRGWTPSWLIGTRKDKEGSVGTTSPVSTKPPSTTAPTTTATAPKIAAAPTTATTQATATTPPTGTTPTISLRSSSSSSSVEARSLKPSLSSSSSSSLFDRHRHRDPWRSSSSTTASTTSNSTATYATTITPATSVFASRKTPSSDDDPLPDHLDSDHSRRASSHLAGLMEPALADAAPVDDLANAII